MQLYFTFNMLISQGLGCLQMGVNAEQDILNHKRFSFLSNIILITILLLTTTIIIPLRDKSTNSIIITLVIGFNYYSAH